jgi:hypothetical protein
MSHTTTIHYVELNPRRLVRRRGSGRRSYGTIQLSTAVDCR